MTTNNDPTLNAALKEMELLRQEVKYLIQLDNERRDHLRKDLREGQSQMLEQAAFLLSEIKRNRRIGKATILLGLIYAGMFFNTMSHGDMMRAIKIFLPFL